MNDDLMDKLRSALLKSTSQKADKDLFPNIVQTILDVSNSTLSKPILCMCTLWRINNNSTQEGEEKKQSISIIARKLTKNKSDFKDILELKGTFIEKTINNKDPEKKRKQFFIGDKTDHKSHECLKELNLNYFIGIPIPDFENPEKTIAVLKLSYHENPEIKQLDSFSNTISEVVSSCMYRYMLYKNKHIMDDLVKNYLEKGAKRQLGDIFRPILHTILCKYCDYEGASLFIWDSFNNHYKLLSTTGIIGLNSKNDYQKVFYLAGDGFTGEAAKQKKTMIYDDLNKEKSNPKHKERFIEFTKNTGKTMMVIPIHRPSKENDIIGILRFVNRKNRVNSSIVDYFNDSDKDIIEYASKYLALIIDYYLGEEERNDFISKLSHEFRSPALLINISADRLIKNTNDSFRDRYLISYLENIRDFSDLQLQQAETNLHISKIRVNTPRSQKYKPEQHTLKDIIDQGKTTVVPFARIERVRFDNIKVDENFPKWELYVDRGAFITVFFNLLNNAIKYRNPKNEFSVIITGKNLGGWLIINVSDYGLGINPDDKEKIFLMGFRGDNVTKYNSDGFGIGLPVVKQIIEDFDGKICVSNPINPTTFEIKLHEKLFNNKYTKETVWNSVK